MTADASRVCRGRLRRPSAWFRLLGGEKACGGRVSRPSRAAETSVRLLPVGGGGGGARPASGKISEVYDSAAERQGAYDFLESQDSGSQAIGDAMARSTARRCAEHDWVYVPLDGTSVKVWDGTSGRKNFGAIGTYTN